MTVVEIFLHYSNWFGSLPLTKDTDPTWGVNIQNKIKKNFFF